MNKIDTRKREEFDIDEGAVDARKPPARAKKCVTPAGYAPLRAELDEMFRVERPRLVERITSAASNDDHADNSAYIHGRLLRCGSGASPAKFRNLGKIRMTNAAP